LNFKSSNPALPGIAEHPSGRTQRFHFIAGAKLLAKKLVRRGRIALQRTILAGLQIALTSGRSKRRNAFMATDSGRRSITLFLAPEAGLEPFYASHVILGSGPAAANPSQAALAVIAGSVRFPPSVGPRDLGPLYGRLLPAPGSPADLAAKRFAALSPAARHAWLAGHLAALRAGRVSVAQLP